MAKRSRSKRKKQHQPDSLPELNSSSKNSRRVPLWQALLLPVTAILVFFLLLEGGLALFGQKPALQDEDPFVGFASNVPLFVPSQGPEGKRIMTTAPNKKYYFNRQKFTRQKSPGTYRIFCLGGSTTYGRPYDDTTSFAGWLRELLPIAESSKNWEVINAGGISYASYRVAHLMEELINYQPDLFIIYTGHNEFLEERTYSQIREMPSIVKSMVSMMARTRTWSAMTTALQSLGIYPQAAQKKRSRLAAEVEAILDKSAGLDRYTRDDPLKKNILQHYQVSLERMVEMARSVNAQIIFVTPGSNLKDCSPFKSEHTEGLDPMDRQRSKKMLAKAKEEIQQKNWHEALNLLETAVALDPRHAELQYLRGKVLLALGRFNQAKKALRLARDEDISPLRALTPMPRIVSQVAREKGAGLVNYVDLLGRRMKTIQGYDIPGKEFFFDHVHPTIEGHKILAVALIKKMIEKGLVQPEANWGKQAIAAAEAKIKDRIDEEKHGFALANLARVSLWAKKIKDAERLAMQALEMAGDNKHIAINATTTLATVFLHQGEPERAVQHLYSAIEKVPGAVELRLKLGQILLNPPFQELEKAAANLLLVSRQIPNYDWAHDLFGIVMAMRDRPRIAYPSLMQALRLNPNNIRSRKRLEDIRPLLKGKTPNPQPADIILDTYASSAPRKLVQVRRDTSGNRVRDGIEVEFHENGRLKRFLDIKQGKPNGLEITWNKDGRPLSRVVYRQGTPVN
jgi:tetratricopeptide (TPR) repeat protein